MDDDEELANENDHSDNLEDTTSTKVDLDRLLSDVGAFGRWIQNGTSPLKATDYQFWLP